MHSRIRNKSWNPIEVYILLTENKPVAKNSSVNVASSLQLIEVGEIKGKKGKKTKINQRKISLQTLQKVSKKNYTHIAKPAILRSVTKEPIISCTICIRILL